ncbi:MAG: DUF1844 domain-containing protein [Thermoguttaceae bacterium]
MSEEPQAKKILVDEDWKSQVQSEKEAVQQPVGEPTPAADDQADQASSPRDVPLPPASLEILLGSLATQAMVSLGILPNPITNRRERLPHQAKHLIDMLAMLETKTQGNRTSEESETLDSILHQLRMAYVSVLKGGGVSDA